MRHSILKWKKGLGDRQQRKSFELVLKDKTLCKIFCGYHSSFLLLKSGELKSWGQNLCGELAIGEQLSDQLTPVLALSDHLIEDLSCGSNHTLILRRDGSVLASGSNSYNQIGYNERVCLYSATLVLESKEEIKQIFCGENHSLLLRRSGELIGLGSGFHFELGKKSKKRQREEGESVNTRIEVGEKVILLSGENPIEWNLHSHANFYIEFQQIVFTFLVCLKESFPKELQLPKPLLSMIINQLL